MWLFLQRLVYCFFQFFFLFSIYYLSSLYALVNRHNYNDFELEFYLVKRTICQMWCQMNMFHRFMLFLMGSRLPSLETNVCCTMQYKWKCDQHPLWVHTAFLCLFPIFMFFFLNFYWFFSYIFCVCAPNTHCTYSSHHNETFMKWNTN